MAELTPKSSAALKPENQLRSTLDPQHPRFIKNAEAIRKLVAEMRQQTEVIHQGGGAKAIGAQHNKKRLTARERIAA